MDHVKIGNLDLNPRQFTALLKKGRKRAGIPDSARIKNLKGPFDGKINSIYMVDFGDGQQETSLIFRARISKVFRYEPTIKEKILYPILDGSLQLQENQDLREDVIRIIKQKEGNHVFNKGRKPAINVQDMYHFDETCSAIPDFYTIMEYIPGISLYEYIESKGIQGKKAGEIDGTVKKQLESLLFDSGTALGKLHEIKFPGFYSSILDIGNEAKEVNWKDLFYSKINLLLKEASKHQLMKDVIQDLNEYFKKNEHLINEHAEPVLFHNDYQPQNIIVDPNKGSINGFIDHDNWQIGVKEQDFVKIQYWGMKGLDPGLFDNFLQGYKSVQKIDKDFQKRVDLYKMAWFVLVFNFEMDKILQNEKNLAVDRRFPSAEKYVKDIKQILYG